MLKNIRILRYILTKYTEYGMFDLKLSILTINDITNVKRGKSHEYQKLV